MNPPVRRLLAATSALAAAVVLAACGGSSSDASSDRTLKVGQLGAAKVNEALLEASGESDGMEYDIEWSLFPAGGPAFMEAVPSKSVDAASMADTPPIFAQVAGIGVKIVGVSETSAPGTSTVEILAARDAGISDVGDLKGKRVAITEATILQYTVVRALEEAGLSYDDIEAVPLAPPDAAAAFQNGDVDAIAALDPQLAQLKAGGAVTVGDGQGITSGYMVGVATDAALADEQKSADVKDYFERLARAEAWAVEHRDEWLPIYAKVSGLPEPIAESILERQASNYVPIDDAVIAKQQEQADVYLGLGLLKDALDVTAQFDDRFNDTLPEAAK